MLFHELLKTWFHWVEIWGYSGVFILMAMESSIIPVPSEVVMPPAAFWAAQGKMDFTGVVLAGTAGSYFGSILNYWICRRLGQPALARFGKHFFITADKLDLAENWVRQFGGVGVFAARLLPVVRHLVSMPAGALRMPVGKFSSATLLGAGLWCAILAWFGQKTIGDHPELLESPQAMVEVIRAKMVWFLVGVVLLILLYVGVIWIKTFQFSRRSTNR